MKALPTLIMMFVLLSIAVTAQVPSNTQRQSEKQNSTAAGPELAEAERLNASVIRLYNEHKFDEAFPIAKRVLEIREKALAADDELIVGALINLAEIQQARGKHLDAQPLFEKALRSVERTSGADSPQVARLLDRLAIVNYANGNPSKTESYYKRALAIREKAFGSEHPATAQSLYSLAEFYQFQGEYKQAEPLYKRVLEVRTKTNSDIASITEAIDRYACLLRKEKRTQEADQLEGQGISVLYPGEDSGQFVMGGVVNGQALNLITPPYPDEARAARASGKVTVRVLINESGDVIRVCALEGPKPLMKASESAAARSKFSPTTVDGKPVKVNGMIIYNFIAR